MDEGLVISWIFPPRNQFCLLHRFYRYPGFVPFLHIHFIVFFNLIYILQKAAVWFMSLFLAIYCHSVPAKVFVILYFVYAY